LVFIVLLVLVVEMDFFLVQVHVNICETVTIMIHRFLKVFLSYHHDEELGPCLRLVIATSQSWCNIMGHTTIVQCFLGIKKSESYYHDLMMTMIRRYELLSS
jgi:hypothetical protein